MTKNEIVKGSKKYQAIVFLTNEVRGVNVKIKGAQTDLDNYRNTKEELLNIIRVMKEDNKK